MHLIFHVSAEWQRTDKEAGMMSLWLQEESRKKNGAKITPPSIESRTLFYEGQRSVVESIRTAPPSTTIICSSWDICKVHTKSLKSALEERRHAQVVLVCLRPYLRLDPRTEETTVALYLLEQSLEASKAQRQEEIKKAWERDIEEGLHERVVKAYCRLKTIPEIAGACEIPETRVRRIIQKELKPKQRERVEARRKDKEAQESRKYQKGAIPTQSRFDYEMLAQIGIEKNTRLFRLIEEHIKTRLSDRTRQVIVLTWKDFFNFMEREHPKRKFQDPNDIREEDLRLWADHLYGRVKKNTAATKFYHLKGFYTFIMESGESARTPFAAFKVPRHQRQSVKAEPLKKEEISALLKVLEGKVLGAKAKPHYWRALRLQTIVRLFLWTGARASSLLSMRLSDVDIQGDFVRLTMLIKGGTTHEVNLPKRVKEDLEQYIKEAHQKSSPDSFLFYADQERRHHPLRYDSLWLELTDAGMEAKIKGLSSHRFRTTFATEAVADGHDLHDVQIMMGLKSHDQMLFYVKKKKKILMPSYMTEDAS